MAQDAKSALRAKLSFEQQARFDTQYERQAKKQGPATVLSLPVLGTFGLEQFYLGNVGSGIIRILFSWTLIPTVLALFEILSGDLKQQVAHANARVAKRVYDEVLRNTPSAESAPASVVDTVITPSAIAEAAAFAAEVSIAPTMTDPGTTTLPFSPTDVANDAATEAAPPAAVTEVAEVITTTPTADAPAATATTPTEVAEVDTTDHQEDVATTTAGAFTVAESTAAWQQGMDAPIVDSDEQTFTVGDATDAVTDSGPTTTAFVAEEAAPAPAASAAPQADLDAEPLATATPSAADAEAAPVAEEGILVFVADDEPLSSDTVTTTTMTTPDETVSETVAQHVEEQQQLDQSTIAEAEHVEAQHYHHGKLVEASRHNIKITGEVSSLLDDTTTDTLLQEVESRSAHAPGWLDVSPLQGGDVTPSSADAAPSAPVTDNASAPTPTTDAAPAAAAADTAPAPPSSSEALAPTASTADTSTATPDATILATDTTTPTPSSDAAAPVAADTTATTASTADVPPTTPAVEAANAGATSSDAPRSAATTDTSATAHDEVASRTAAEPTGGNDGAANDSGAAPSSGTDIPGGGLGGPATNVPGGAVGDPSTDPGTNVPAGGIGSPTPDGGDAGTASGTPPTDDAPGHQGHDRPIEI